ncbi:hypothetical protein EUX98_g2471 [Antrodiella citrinella]|uniref:Enoyl reductase (ER) domain-containing protein n=1 Tax=Antrodiella citrinella TaxID=2447956 RepID=A0A4S4MYW0_9APHY|nr:hypothetical protein EUX98_g2471 [Antrodiella citrinella]
MSIIPETHEAVGLEAVGGPLTSFQRPTLKPGRDQVLVRVLWTAGGAVTVWIVDFNLTNPELPYVVGENIVGEVVVVGEGVTDLKPGDKILSFSFPEEAYGKAAQEYSLLSKWNVGKLPSNITPQEAATVPDNLVTAYFTLFDQLPLPATSLPATSPPAQASTPILVWGAGGSTGRYAIQLLHLAGYQKVLAVASSRHHEYLRTIGASATFDYNASDITQKILDAAGGAVPLVFDTIADEDNSLRLISQVVSDGSKVAYLLPVREGGHGAVHGVKWKPDGVAFPKGVELVAVATRLYQKASPLHSSSVWQKS